MLLDVGMTVHDIARRLPGIPVLRDRCRALAMLDAILSPEWADRYYSYDSRWSGAEEMASMRDGAGNEYAIVFSPAGAYACGFAHESLMSPYAAGGPWPGVLDEVPEAFRPYVEEPAFSDGDGTPVVTVCMWRQPQDAAWRAGAIDFPEDGTDDPDGAGYLFALPADGSAEAYRGFAEDYYELPVDLEAVRHVHALRPLTPEVIAALNPDVDLADLAKDIEQIGYPRG